MTAVAHERPEGAEPILRLRGVGRRFGGVLAVRDVDLDVAAGERRAILGPNGAGKTTLFNLISGEFPPTAGSIEVFGRDVTRLPARARPHMGLTRTFQKSRLFLGLTVEDNIYLAVLGVKRGHLRPLRTGADRADARRGPASSPASSASAASCGPSSARSRTASSASSRSPWPGPATPRS